MSQHTIGIGALSRATSVPVRTIRFYCDEGVLVSVRSSGGHRRFALDAVEQLRLVRRLRGLGLGLPSIVDVLAEKQSVADVVAAERKALDVEVATLSWRRAALRAVEEASPVDRAARLELLSAVQNGRDARNALLAFWQRQFEGPAPTETLDMFLDATVPALPTAPTVAQVVAYAEMVTLVDDPDLRLRFFRSRRRHADISDTGELQAGIGEACALAHPLVVAGRSPHPGHALDVFVGVHAIARGRHDSTPFRRDLLEDMSANRTPQMRRYWRLVGTVTGEPVPIGATHTWLLDALAEAVTESP